MNSDFPFDLQTLRAAYADGASPVDVITEVYRRIESLNDPGIFITVREKQDVLDEANALEQGAFAEKPLWGIPFVVKDNIDATGMPTTAACPEFAYEAEQDAFVVARLRAAGALLIGKTNLDQFATGLVGVRTPYPVPVNALDPEIVPGGSSSGSAVAVAQGLVTFSLGTDTAGSGRVPAALNGIVGLKPSLGALSNRGVLPACRTLDTLSVFSLTVDDAFDILASAAAFDPDDAFSRKFPAQKRSPATPHYRVGIPDRQSIEFFGDLIQARAFDQGVNLLRDLGADIIELDFEPFFKVAELLYNGPWVAERHTVIENLLAKQPDAVHPVTRQITEVALQYSATETFRAMYRVQELARDIDTAMVGTDLLCVPSIPRFVTCAELEDDPIGPNTQLGTYTNFVNLLDMCAITVPVMPRPDGRPGSLTLIAKSGQDSFLAILAGAIQQQAKPPLGATKWSFPVSLPVSEGAGPDELPIVVVGAHMSGLPLNHELTKLNARFLRKVRTSENYKFYKLAGDPPARPGLIRDHLGAAIDAEVWALPVENVGTFLSGIPAPLGIGTIRLDDGSTAQGFLCEQIAAQDAEDITHFGGWRGYLASLKPDSSPDKEHQHATA